MILYPQLPRSPKVEQLAVDLADKSVAECRRRRGFGHDDIVFSPTGGTPATRKELERIADSLTAIAIAHGYPEACREAQVADAKWAESLHRNCGISPHEAALDPLWQFFTCVLTPDLVRWRWSGESTGAVSDHWVTVKHRGRNCFGRLWWRAEILRDPTAANPYELLHELGEDECVQLMERPWLAGHRDLSRMTARLLLVYGRRHPDRGRSGLFREVQKRLLRSGAFLEFEVLDDEHRRELVAEAFEKSLLVPAARR